MRECIYCGKSLEKGEECTCAMSVSKRMQKQADAKQEKENKRAEKNAEKKAKREEKERMRRAKAYAKQSRSVNTDNPFKAALNLFVSFIKSPIDTVMNPGEMSWAVILILVLFEGIIAGLCVFSAVTGAVRGPISILGNAMGFGGMNGYELLRGWGLAMLSGAISGVVMFFLYSGIFFLVNKFIMRQFSPYREFVKRFTCVALPIAIFGILSVLLGFFSYTTFILLLVTGLVGSVIITYEILKSVWYMKKPTTVMYSMMLCIFIFMTVIANFIKIA